eukprot:gene5719-6906_t
MHARNLHVVMVSEDLDTYLHVHPSDFGDLDGSATAFPVTLDVQRSGRYLLSLDFVVQSEEINMCVTEEASHMHEGRGSSELTLIPGAVRVPINVTVPGTKPYPQFQVALHGHFRQDGAPPLVDPRRTVSMAAQRMAGKNKFTRAVSMLRQQAECCQGPSGCDGADEGMAVAPGCYEVTVKAHAASGVDMGRGVHDDPDEDALPATDLVQGNLGGLIQVEADQCIVLSFHIRQAGGDVTDLKPYLNAEAHLMVVAPDLKFSMHAHGSADLKDVSEFDKIRCTHMHMRSYNPPESFGPRIVSMNAFTTPGLFK